MEIVGNRKKKERKYTRTVMEEKLKSTGKINIKKFN